MYRIYICMIIVARYPMMLCFQQCFFYSFTVLYCFSMYKYKFVIVLTVKNFNILYQVCMILG